VKFRRRSIIEVWGRFPLKQSSVTSRVNTLLRRQIEVVNVLRGLCTEACKTCNPFVSRNYKTTSHFPRYADCKSTLTFVRNFDKPKNTVFKAGEKGQRRQLCPRRNYFDISIFESSQKTSLVPDYRPCSRLNRPPGLPWNGETA